MYMAKIFGYNVRGCQALSYALLTISQWEWLKEKFNATDQRGAEEMIYKESEGWRTIFSLTRVSSLKSISSLPPSPPPHQIT